MNAMWKERKEIHKIISTQRFEGKKRKFHYVLLNNIDKITTLFCYEKILIV